MMTSQWILIVAFAFVVLNSRMVDGQGCPDGQVCADACADPDPAAKVPPDTEADATALNEKCANKNCKPDPNGHAVCMAAAPTTVTPAGGAGDPSSSTEPAAAGGGGGDNTEAPPAEAGVGSLTSSVLTIPTVMGLGLNLLRVNA